MDSAVLVLSCDKYSHIWPAFFKCWQKYFPDCRLPVYLGSNTQPFQHNSVKTLLSNGDPDWSTSLLRILDQIPEKRIFIILEDLLLASPMNTGHFSQAFDFMVKKQAKYIKYYLPSYWDEDVPGEPFRILARGNPRRHSVVAFWDKEYLKSILIAGESPWNFEILGTYRTSYTDGFFTMKNTLCEFANMIERGHWDPKALRWAEKEGLDVGRSSRPIMRGGVGLKSIIQSVVYRLMFKIPWRTRVNIVNFLRRLFISY